MRLICLNWKMCGNLQLLQEYGKLLTAPGIMPLVLLPATLLHKASDLLDFPWAIGAQTCHNAASGAFTGHISASMLYEAGARYVLIGHSERRDYESEDYLRGAYELAVDAGLQPILCIGETLAQRSAVYKVLEQQLSWLAQAQTDEVWVAYEPRWAIGSGQTPKVPELQELFSWLRSKIKEICPRQTVKIRLLYGGSLNASNLEAFLDIKDIEGGLIGGASLKIEQVRDMLE